MKNLVILISIIFTNLIFSQTDQCNSKNIQLETYDFALKNLKKIRQNIKNRQSQIEISIDFEIPKEDESEEISYSKPSKLSFYLVTPEDLKQRIKSKQIEVCNELKII